MNTGCGSRALHFAANNWHTETVAALLADGADFDAGAVNGCTVLHIAGKKGHTKTVKVLLDVGQISRREPTVDGVHFSMCSVVYCMASASPGPDVLKRSLYSWMMAESITRWRRTVDREHFKLPLRIDISKRSGHSWTEEQIYRQRTALQCQHNDTSRPRGWRCRPDHIQSGSNARGNCRWRG